MVSEHSTGIDPSRPLVFEPREIPAGMVVVQPGLLADPLDDGRWLSFSRALSEDVQLPVSMEHINGVPVALGLIDGRHTAVVAADTEWCVVVTGLGISGDDFRSAVVSMALVAERDAFKAIPDDPIDSTVPSSVVGSWLESDSPVQVMEGTGILPLRERGKHDDLVVMAGGVGGDGVLLAVLEKDANPLEEVALMVPGGRLVELGGLPCVVGWDIEAQRAHVMWAHRGRFWHLLGKRSTAELVDLAGRIQERVASVG